jgi:hypothetical protein
MSIDIVRLIESNPIIQFSGDYQSKLIEKVKNTFSNYEQQMFLSSFYCYLKYDSKNDFIIDLDNVWKWLGFNKKYHAKYLLEKQFIINNDYKIFAAEASVAKKVARGGHNKETIMLNVDTFKRFCLKAGTKKADEVHEYFIKLENILFETTKEECEELKQQLLNLEDVKNKETQEKLIKQKELNNEKFLLREYENIGSIFYIIKVKSLENGEYIIKIGESRKGILDRYKQHKSNYEECLLLNCFKVDKSKEFETFIKHHEKVVPNNYKNLKGHEKELELFLIGKELTYQMVLKIVDNNIDNYNYKVKELLLEIENYKLHNNNNNNNQNNDNDNTNLLKNLIQNNQMLTNKVCSLETSIQQILNILLLKEPRLVTGFNQQMPHLGPRLQKIHPETLQLIKVFESVTETMNQDKNIKRPSITKAVEENTIYCGFRWQLVERNLDPNIVYSLQPTKKTKSQHLGYIAKLDENKSEILNVYLDRKTAAKLNGYQSLSALDNQVKNNTKTNGHYYMLYNTCESKLTQVFEEKYGKPLLYKNGIGQYDVQGNLIREFSCKYECIKQLQISDKTLTKSLSSLIPYNNYYYKELGEKLSNI